MNQKLKLGLLGVGILAGISLSIYWAVSDHSTEARPDNANKTPLVSTDAPSNTPVVSPDPSQTANPNETKDPADNKDKGDVYEKPPEKVKREANKGEVLEAERKARELFRNFEFTKGIESLQPMIDTLSDKGEGSVLYQLYHDATLLAFVVHSPLDEESDDHHHEAPDLQGIKNIFGNIHDPEDALLGTLGLNPKVRVKVILHNESLNPIFHSTVRILGDSEETGKDVDRLRLLYTEMKTLHKINFEVDDNQLYAYVIEFNNGVSKVHSIHEAVPGTTYYKTVKEWEKIYEQLNK